MPDRLRSAAAAAGVAFLLSFGALGCLITAFALEASLPALALFSGIWSVLLGAALAFGPAWFNLGAFAVITWLLIQFGGLIASAERLVYAVTEFYHMAYGVGPLYFGQLPPQGEGSCVLALYFLGGLVAAGGALAVSRGRNTFLAGLLSLAPLAACMVVTDTVPAAPPLFCLLLGLALLLLPQAVRRRNPIQGSRLTALLALPLALILGLLFLLSPRQTYAGQAYGEKALSALKDWSIQVLEHIQEQTGETLGLDLNPGALDTDRVDLSIVGQVLTVTAPQDGPIYLRGSAFDTYDGRSWSNSGGADWERGWPEDLEPLGDVTVRTDGAHPVLYFPYYVDAPGWARELEDGALPNPEGLTAYTFPQAQAAPSALSGDFSGADPAYLELPDETREWAEGVLADLGVAYPSAEAVERIAEYVRDSATYDLNTPRLPDGETDFARWFLTESDTGYCVHFATAGAVLLRAAGIPARYATGYMVMARANRVTPAQPRNAHAWVEYYNGEYWTVLECTPGQGLSLRPNEEGTSPTETPTEAPTASASTLPEGSGEATLPEHTQAPSRPQGPAGPTDGDGTGPSGTPGEQRPSFPWKALLTALAWIAGVVLAVGAVIGQWKLRLLLRARRFAAGDPNRQALTRWRFYVYECRLLGQKPSGALRSLAQKAKYSQHILDASELSALDQGLAENLKTFRSKSPPLQILYRLVLALY